MRWSIGLGLGWAVLAGISFYGALLPTSYWMIVDDVYVDDAKTGECPTMKVQRRVNRSFVADWEVRVMREQTSGGFALYEKHGSHGDYKPDVVLPDNLDLAWWTLQDADRCPMPAGTYRLETIWFIEGGKLPDQELRNISNEFKVTE